MADLHFVILVRLVLGPILIVEKFNLASTVLQKYYCGCLGAKRLIFGMLESWYTVDLSCIYLHVCCRLLTIGTDMGSLRKGTSVLRSRFE